MDHTIQQPPELAANSQLHSSESSTVHVDVPTAAPVAAQKFVINYGGRKQIKKKPVIVSTSTNNETTNILSTTSNDSSNGNLSKEDLHSIGTSANVSENSGTAEALSGPETSPSPSEPPSISTVDSVTEAATTLPVSQSGKFVIRTRTNNSNKKRVQPFQKYISNNSNTGSVPDAVDATVVTPSSPLSNETPLSAAPLSSSEISDQLQQQQQAEPTPSFATKGKNIKIKRNNDLYRFKYNIRVPACDT
jgi:hypothetical protein